LQELGVVDEGYTELLNQLVSFLTTAGLQYEDGEWTADPHVPLVAGPSRTW
jgi:hypothetical protein